MKVTVLGSGILGVTSAYYLARQGHEVTVLDRQPGPGLETSYANAGQVSPGYSAPWAAPGIPLKALKWMLSQHSPLVIRPQADPHQWRWLLQMLRNCTSARYAVNKERMLRVAAYSRESLDELRAETGIVYDEGMRGTLQLFRTQKQLDAAAKDIAVLERCGVPYELLDRAGCVAAEPALALTAGRIVGGLRLPLDETGDCFKFTQALAGQARDLGVDFRYGVGVRAVIEDGGRVRGLDTGQGPHAADTVVVAAGSYSRALLRPLGLDLPVYPVKGYSLTLPVTDPEGAPVSTVMDETYKVAVTRLGDRIRVAGTAELAGFDLSLRDSRRATIAHVVNDLFPSGGDLGRAEFWAGLRPMTPDGTPLIGATPVAGLYLNTGHGTLGWTMSCGSARLLADIIGGRRPQISADGLGLSRYGRPAAGGAGPESGATPARPAAA